MYTYNLTTYAGNLYRQGTLPNQTGELNRWKGENETGKSTVTDEGKPEKNREKVHYKSGLGQKRHLISECEPIFASHNFPNKR